MYRITLIFLMFAAIEGKAQKITFSQLNKKETGNMYFEILGRFGNTALVYKNISREHVISRYDNDMQLKSQVILDFIPEKAFNLDFINYNEYLIGVYQYQKNNIVSCYAFRLDSNLVSSSSPIIIDTAKIGFYADNKIYNMSFSDNKQQILIYKRTLKNDIFTLATKTFNPELKMTDSSICRQHINSRRDYFGEPAIDNQGSIFFCFTHESGRRANSDSLSVFHRNLGQLDFEVQKIDLDHFFIEDPVIKADNLNKKYLINAYATKEVNAETTGLFTAVLDLTWEVKYSRYNEFSQEVKQSLNTSGYNNLQSPTLSPKNIILKKNNGFTLIAECSYSDNRNSGSTNGTYYGGYPYGYANDYLFYDPYSVRYRPWGSNAAYQQARFHYDNIIMLSLDSTLNVINKTVINKKQTDVETDNFLSFGTFTGRGELHFLFLERDRRRDVISDHALQADGMIKRYPTISSNETNNEFMPKLGKQISSKQYIIPYSYLNRIGFAKIEWP